MPPTFPQQEMSRTRNTPLRIAVASVLLLAAAAAQAASETDLSILKAVDNPLPQEGETVVFTLTLANNGPKTAANIQVQDLLPPGLSYVSDDSGGDYDPTTGLWRPAGRLAAGETLRLNITATVNYGTVGTALTNTATISVSTHIDPFPGNDSSSALVTVVGPSLTLLKSALTTSDPVNGALSPFSIPGATVLYSIQATNSGLGVPDSDTVVITDSVPAGTELYVGDLGAAGSGPVLLLDGSAPAQSGLTYAFGGLGSATDDLEFSADNGSTWTYTPIPDIDGYDPGVTDIRVAPKGVMGASDGSVHPTFSIRFQVRVK